MPPDAMHDVLEGVLQYEAKELLKYCINEQRYVTLAQLNHSIVSFDFGYYNDTNKPSPESGKNIGCQQQLSEAKRCDFIS